MRTFVGSGREHSRLWSFHRRITGIFVEHRNIIRLRLRYKEFDFNLFFYTCLMTGSI
jgi:hypothetical protein